MKIAVIGGGNMGGAIVSGIIRSGFLTAQAISVSDINEATLARLQVQHPGINVTYNNIEACTGADFIVISVKPWFLLDVISQIRPHLDYSKQTILSIAAGVSCNELTEMFKFEDNYPNIYRIVPNTAIAINQSMTFISTVNGSNSVTQKVCDIFSQLGKVSIIEERLVSAATSIGSCGTAFAFRYIRASIAAGIELGLSSDESKQVVLQTLKGAVELLLNGGEHPEAEIDKVTTPGGLTIRGLNELEHSGFSSSIVKGYKATR
ncbi:MAG: pyrroline-5-carboxylate reductase [Bacteroidales bacterium]